MPGYRPVAFAWGSLPSGGVLVSQYVVRRLEDRAEPSHSRLAGFAAGNPISGIEYDGHTLLDSPGGGGDAPEPTNSPGCGTWGLPACNTEPKTEPLPWVPVSTGDGGDALGGAANSAIELSELANSGGPLSSLTRLANLLGFDPYDAARGTVNDELNVDTTTNAYAAGGIAFDVATVPVGGGAGTAAKAGAAGGRGVIAWFSRTFAKSCSFSGDTTVLMADGEHKPISEIEPGDEVTATDPETGEQGPKKVEEVYKHWDRMSDLVLEDGTILTTTEDHPYWSVDDQKFERADQLGRGERVLQADGGAIQVVEFRWAVGLNSIAYNLAIEGIHTYHVGTGEILVHNHCSKLLGRNLQAAGWTRLPEEHAHHIVPGGHPDAAPARAVLKRFDIDIDAANNGVFLPGYKRSLNPRGATEHLGYTNTSPYIDMVNDRLGQVSSRTEALQELASIRYDLLSGQRW